MTFLGRRFNARQDLMRRQVTELVAGLPEQRRAVVTACFRDLATTRLRAVGSRFRE